MCIRKMALVAVCLGMLAAAPASVEAQGCKSSQSAAVKCFVTNAVETNLATVPSGMTLTQYQSYGVAVSSILQTHHTYLVLLGVASAVADAMPATNNDGSANQAAQDTAVNAIVDAALANSLITLPVNTSTDQLKMFSRDVVAAMETNDGVTLAPGSMLRMIDSYIVTATTAGTVNWAQVYSGIATLVSSLTSSGLLKIPTTMTVSQVTSFADQLAQIIYNYKVATGRASL